MSDKVSGAGVTEKTYLLGMPERVLSEDFKEQSGYIFRAKVRPMFRPPYAVDIFVRLVGLSLVTDKPSVYAIAELDLEDADTVQRWQKTINNEGFAVVINNGKDRYFDLPDGISEVGYFLAATAINNTEQILLATEPSMLSS